MALRGHTCAHIHTAYQSKSGIQSHSGLRNITLLNQPFSITGEHLSLSQQLKSLQETHLYRLFRPPCPIRPLPSSRIRAHLGDSPWLSKKRSQVINKNSSKPTGRQSQNTRKENVSSFISGTRGYFMEHMWLNSASRAGRAALGTCWAGPYSALSPTVTGLVM